MTKCLQGKCGHYLPEWDKHELCHSCRERSGECAGHDAPCDVCKDWPSQYWKLSSMPLVIPVQSHKSIGLRETPREAQRAWRRQHYHELFQGKHASLTERVNLEWWTNFEEKIDNYNGYVKDYETAIKVHESFQIATSCIFTERRNVRGFGTKDVSSLKKDRDLTVLFSAPQYLGVTELTDESDGIPFICFRKLILHCKYRHLRRVPTAQSYVNGQNAEEGDVSEEKGQRPQGCSAVMQMLEMFRLPQYQLQQDTRESRQETVSKIKNEVANLTQSQIQHRIFISLPQLAEHSDHPVGELAYPLLHTDPRIEKKIYHLYSEGVRDVEGVQRALTDYVKTCLFADQEPPSEDNRMFFPNVTYLERRLRQVANTYTNYKRESAASEQQQSSAAESGTGVGVYFKVVEANSPDTEYRVSLDPERPSCSCERWSLLDKPCKHVVAIFNQYPENSWEFSRSTAPATELNASQSQEWALPSHSTQAAAVSGNKLTARQKRRTKKKPGYGRTSPEDIDDLAGGDRRDGGRSRQPHTRGAHVPHVSDNFSTRRPGSEPLSQRDRGLIQETIRQLTTETDMISASMVGNDTADARKIVFTGMESHKVKDLRIRVGYLIGELTKLTYIIQDVGVLHRMYNNLHSCLHMLKTKCPQAAEELSALAVAECSQEDSDGGGLKITPKRRKKGRRRGKKFRDLGEPETKKSKQAELFHEKSQKRILSDTDDEINPRKRPQKEKATVQKSSAPSDKQRTQSVEYRDKLVEYRHLRIPVNAINAEQPESGIDVGGSSQNISPSASQTQTPNTESVGSGDLEPVVSDASDKTPAKMPSPKETLSESVKKVDVNGGVEGSEPSVPTTAPNKESVSTVKPDAKIPIKTESDILVSSTPADNVTSDDSSRVTVPKPATPTPVEQGQDKPETTIKEERKTTKEEPKKECT